MADKIMKKAYIANQPIWATITQGNLHVERRCYESNTDNRHNVYYVKCNGLWISTEELKSMGDKVDIWW